MTKGVVIVFGGTSGYGAGVHEALLTAGYNAKAVSRASGTDVRDEASMEALFALLAPEIESEGLAGVFYSAGLAIDKQTVEDGDPANWWQVMETNCLGMMLAAKLAIPHLRKSRGHFMAVGSIATEIAYAGAADYCASKVAQTRVMQALRYELLGTGIRQTIFEVGLGETNFQNQRYRGDAEKAKAHFGNIRQLQPEDLANAALWVLSLPEHVNVDSITLKPLDQAHHGHIAKRP